KLSLRLDHLVVSTDKVTTIPLNEIGQLLIENPSITMTGHLINALSSYKITTIVCNDKHLPHAHINLIYGHFRQHQMIKQLIGWSDERKDMLWKYSVKEKIKNQYQNIEYLGIDHTQQFNNYIQEVELDDTSNKKKHAAKVYFN